MSKTVGTILTLAYAAYTQNWPLFFATLAGTAYSDVQRRRAGRRARDEYNASLADRLEMVDLQPEAARTLVLGRCRTVEGVRRRWVSGTNSEVLTMVVSVAGHQIDGFEKHYFWDTELTVDGDGWVQTAPYNKVRSESRQQTFTWPGGASASFVLDAEPVAGSASVPLVGSQPGTVTTTTGSTTVGVALGEAQDPGFVFRLNYQGVVSTSTARIRTWLGAPGQNVGAALAAEYPGKITTTDRFEGMAVAVIDVYFDPDVYPQGRPNYNALIRGALVLDPRTSTTAWSENPALLANFYARHANGYALPAGEINTADVIAAADVCDTSTTFTLRDAGGATSTVTLPRHRCGIVIATSGNPREAMVDILQTMAGRSGWAGGTWRMRAGAMASPSFTLTADWLALKVDSNGQAARDAVWRASNGVARDEKVNRVSGTCIDPAQRWQALPFPAVQDAVLIAAEGQYAAEVQMPGVNHIAHAQHLGTVLIRENQAALRMEARCNLLAYRTELFDVGTLVLPRYGMTVGLAKTAEVIGWRWHPTEGVQLQLAEISADIYTPVAELVGRDPAPNSTLPPITTVEVLTITGITSGTAPLSDGSIITRTRVVWSPAVNAAVRVGGEIELQYTEADDDLPAADWPSWVEQGTATEAIIPGLRSGQQYLFRVRAVKRTPNVNGPWSAQVAHQVALPPVVSARTLRLMASSLVFHVATDASFEPATITLTALPQNLAGSPTFSVVTGSATLTGSGDTRTLAYAGLTTLTAQIQVAQDGLTDTITITKVFDGADGGAAAPAINLAPPVLVVQADGAGNIVNTATAVSQVTVTEGGADVTIDWDIGKSDGPGILSKITPGSPPQVEVLTFGSAADTATVLSLDVTQAIGTLTGPLVDSSYRRLLVQPYTHATLSVAPTIVATGPAADRRSVQFNGSSGQASGLITAAADDYDVGITSTFTLEFWLQVPATTPTWLQYLALVRDSAGTVTSWGLRFDTSNRIALVGSTTLNTAALTAGTWHHYALTKAGSTLTAYLNGTLVGTVSIGGTVASNKPRLHLGFNPAAPASSGFTGALAAIKFHTSQKYATNFTPAESLTLATADDALYPLVQLLTYLDGNLVDQKGHSFGQQGVTYVTDADGTAAVMNGDGSNTNGIFGASSSYDFDLQGDFCMEATFKLSAQPTRPRTILAVINAANNNIVYELALENEGSSGNRSMVCHFPLSGSSDQTYRSSLLALSTAHHFAMVRKGNSYFFFLDGVRQDFAAFTSSFRHPSGPYLCNIGNYKVGWSDSLAGSIYWTRITSGNCRYTGDFAVPPQPPNAGQGSYIDVTATKLASIITRRLPVSKVPTSVPVVGMTLSPASLTLAADYLGNVPSFTGANTTITVKVNGVDDSSNWALAITPSAGVTATLTGRVVAVTGFTSGVDTGTIEVVATRTGYTTQSLFLSLGKAKSAKPAQTQALDKVVLVIAGETGGQVPAASYTGAAVTMTVALGGVDDTANWTFSHAASSGLTVSRTANVVSVTNMADATDNGTIDITATRSGWTTTTLRCTVTKTKLLPPTGVVPPTSEVFLLASTNTGNASATIQLLPDGTIDQVLANGSPSPIPNWYSPTTSAVGAGYWVRADVLAGLPVSTGTTGTWQQLNVTRSWSRAVVSAGGGFVSQTRLRIRIATDSAGATVVGTFTCLLQTYSE